MYSFVIYINVHMNFGRQTLIQSVAHIYNRIATTMVSRSFFFFRNWIIWRAEINEQKCRFSRRTQREFLSFLFISDGEIHDDILGVPWRADVSSLLSCRQDLVLIRRTLGIATRSRNANVAYLSSSFHHLYKSSFILP